MMPAARSRMPPKVLFEGSVLHDGFPGIAVVGLLARAHELHLDALVVQHRGTEVLEYAYVRMDLRRHGFREGDAAPLHHDVDIRVGAAQEAVADIAADDEGAHPEVRRHVRHQLEDRRVLPERRFFHEDEPVRVTLEHEGFQPIGNHDITHVQRVVVADGLIHDLLRQLHFRPLAFHHEERLRLPVIDDDVGPVVHSVPGEGDLAAHHVFGDLHPFVQDGYEPLPDLLFGGQPDALFPERVPDHITVNHPLQR